MNRENFVEKMEFEDFLFDEKVKSAVLWQIHIIGEATKYFGKKWQDSEIK
ncbi:MAG: HepT-like ribonuclease domain-containing protein [candidate division WOR-3 bacterium]|jgi:uncharacterized protein with HEPN domain